MRTGVYLDPVGNGPLPEFPQEELGHEPVAGALVEEAHAHHGGGLGGRRDLHLGQRQEGGDVEAEHLGDLGGWKVRPTYMHPRRGGGSKRSHRGVRRASLAGRHAQEDADRGRVVALRQVVVEVRHGQGGQVPLGEERAPGAR
jgi:hypothetical protein